MLSEIVEFISERSLCCDGISVSNLECSPKDRAETKPAGM